MTFLRFLMLFSLVVWLGGIIFFGSVVAPTLFGVLPTRHLSGMVVTRVLGLLHWIGVAAGMIFLGSSLMLSNLESGAAQLTAPRHILIVLMLALTLVSQLGISPRMAALRAEMGEIDLVQQDDPRRVEFNRLHRWSTRLEGGTLLLGLAVVFLVARRMGT